MRIRAFFHVCLGDKGLAVVLRRKEMIETTDKLVVVVE